MAINLSHLIFNVTRGLNDIGIEHYDPKLVYEDLSKAYDHIVMLSDYTTIDLNDLRESSLKRCLINLAIFYGYRTYTRLAERNLGTMPESSGLQITYDQDTARVCLELLFQIQLNVDLSPIDLNIVRNPFAISLGPSILTDENDT